VERQQGWAVCQDRIEHAWVIIRPGSDIIVAIIVLSIGLLFPGIHVDIITIPLFEVEGFQRHTAGQSVDPVVGEAGKVVWNRDPSVPQLHVLPPAQNLANIPVQNTQSVGIFQCKIFSQQGHSNTQYSAIRDIPTQNIQPVRLSQYKTFSQ
jgi:hypothetical protein